MKSIIRRRNETKDGLLRLAELKGLTKLELEGSINYEKLVTPLMNAFANASLCLERQPLLMERQPLLMELLINTNPVTPIALRIAMTVDGLREIVQNGKHLERFLLGTVKHLHIDQNVFDNLLDTIKSGTPNRQLYIYISGTSCGKEWNHKQFHLRCS